MPFGSVVLLPGVNVERTPTLLEAGYSQSSLIRFKDRLVQKLGGWLKFYGSVFPGIPRALHAWEDLNQINHLAVGSTTQLGVITSGTLSDVTPQTKTTNFAPAIQTTANSSSVVINDPNISNVTTYDSVYFNTPVSAGGLILSGLYPISVINGTNAFSVQSTSTATNTNTLATNGTTASGNAILHFASVPAWVTTGMLIADLTIPASVQSDSVVNSIGTASVTMSKNATGSGVTNGHSIVLTSLPRFATTTASTIVSVEFVGHGRSVNDVVVFPIATAGGGITISGSYSVTSVADANDYSITASSKATSAATFDMNAGLAELVYYIQLGPPTIGSGYGFGGYGSGGYGTGTTSSAQTGTDITATDYTLDNWGTLLLACPKNGGLYYWDPNGGYQNAGLVNTGPIFNSGMFVSMSVQILVTYGSTVTEGIGLQQDPMLVKWSDSGNFLQWAVNSNTQAGSFRIPIGSKIVGGQAMSLKNLIWTDLDLWAMTYVGPPNVYGFDKIGAGAGLASAHAADQLRGNIYWMGRSNFYVLSGSGVQVIPCSVWDAVFQDLDTANLDKVRAAPNTPFNEMWWFYPSTSGGTGECDKYVKVNITEPGQPWDYGTLGRSAWIDQSVLGSPIAATSSGLIYQHESTNNADGQPLTPSFTTGYFYLSEGEDFAFIDQIIPDFKFGSFGGSQAASIQITFNVVDYLGDTPRTYGPYTVTNSTEYITTRFRGRQMSLTVSSSDLNSFWRLGRVRYRYTPDGRR